jgi:hypothetical protein
MNSTVIATARTLESKIAQKQAMAGVIGLGYAGLPSL